MIKNKLYMMKENVCFKNKKIIMLRLIFSVIFIKTKTSFHLHNNLAHSVNCTFQMHAIIYDMDMHASCMSLNVM